MDTIEISPTAVRFSDKIIPIRMISSVQIIEQEVERPIPGELQARRRRWLLGTSFALLATAILQSVMLPNENFILPFTRIQDSGVQQSVPWADAALFGTLQLWLCVLATALAALACMHPVAGVKRYALSIRSTSDEERRLWSDDERYTHLMAARLNQALKLTNARKPPANEPGNVTLNPALWATRLSPSLYGELEAVLNPALELLAEDLSETLEWHALEDLRGIVAALNANEPDRNEFYRLRRRLNARIELFATEKQQVRDITALWKTITAQMEKLEQYFHN